MTQKPKNKNGQGMAYDLTETYEPGLSRKSDYDPLSHDDFNAFTLMELEALKEYAKDVDMPRACAAAGYVDSHGQAARMLAKDKFRAEIAIIHNVWKTNLEMTAQHGSAVHINLMKKFEKDYDKLDATTGPGESNIKGQLAGVLGKMSADRMKASGNMDGKSGQEAQVVINIHGPDTNVAVTVEKKSKKKKEIVQPDPKDFIDVTPEPNIEDLLS